MSEYHPCIVRASERYEISPGCIDEYQAAFAKCEDWYRPTNRHNDDYRCCAVLHKVGLLDERRTCVHRAGMFRGYRIEFKQSEMAKHIGGES